MMEREKARSAQPGNSPIKEATELEEELTPRPSRRESELGAATGLSPTQLAPSSGSSYSSLSDDTGTREEPRSDGTRKTAPQFDAPPGPILIEPTAEQEADTASKLRHYLINNTNGGQVDEQTPLLGSDSVKPTRDSNWDNAKSRNIVKRANWELKRRMKKLTWTEVASACLLDPVKTLPSVILGMLLNVLDGVSYGMIL